MAQQQEDDAVLTQVCDAAVVVTLSAPAFRNALSVEMREDLLAALLRAGDDPACRFIVLTGAGGNFCAGGRLAPDVAPDPERTSRNVGTLHEIVRLLHRGPKPTIAAVEGFAYGAGFSLAMACDYVVAAGDARFCASFAKVGLMPDCGIAWTLPQRIGAFRARDLLLTAREVDGQEAEQLGLVDSLVSAGSVLDAAITAGQRYVRVAPLAIAATKRVLDTRQSLEGVLEAEVVEQPQLTLSSDYAEGRAAFYAKRAPQFRGL